MKKATEQTAADVATGAGLESLLQLSRMVDTSPQTLRNWHKKKPKLFKAVCEGAFIVWANNNFEEEKKV